MAKDNLVDMLRRAVRADLDEMSRSGFRPVEFEIGLDAQLDTDWPEDLQGLPVQGRLDRVDHDAGNDRYRVIDYKYKSGAAPGTGDNNPVREAMRGQKLQLPIYILLAADYANARGLSTPAAVEPALIPAAAEKTVPGPSRFTGSSGAGTFGEPNPAAPAWRRFPSRVFVPASVTSMPATTCRNCEGIRDSAAKDHFPPTTRAGASVRGSVGAIVSPARR